MTGISRLQALDPVFPPLFPRQESRIPHFCHRYPEYRFLSQYRSRAQILANPASWVAVKSVSR